MKTGAHTNNDAIERLIYYMYTSAYYDSGDTCMVFDYNIESIINSFVMVQNHFGKADRKRIQHIVIGFSKSEFITDYEACMMGMSALQYIGSRFQCCFVVHHGSINEPDYIHIHIAVNPVSWMDGNRYYECNQNLIELKEVLDKQTGEMYQWHYKMDASDSYETEQDELE